jgi:hypothetical protein
MPPAKLTSTKRFAVRLSLVTGSTLATIIGAQSLASIDKLITASPDPAVTSPELQPALTSAPPNGSGVTPSADAAHVAPAITILRRPGQTGANTTSNVNIQPPAPVQITAPDPVIVQEPSAPVIVQAPGAAPAAAPAPASRPATRSSRR